MPNTAMTYQQALDYLYRFIHQQQIPSTSPQEAQHKLTRMRSLLQAIGNPQHALCCIVVAGTNGKGSTCAMLESIARAAGYRTGLWTSPHLQSYRERIQVNRCLISRADLTAAVASLQSVIESAESLDMTNTTGSRTPTTFELGLALALRSFADQGVQLAFLEVGIGGRYDAANVVTPLVSAVASIGYDHRHILGSTLAEIAYDKAGILKPGVPAVTVPQHDEAGAVLENVAREIAAPLWVAEAETMRQVDTPGQLLAYPVPPVPSLRGDFQIDNARLAVSVSLLLRRQGFALPDDALREGLATVQWPGRFELAGESPLLLLDGAHNSDSAEKLIASLRAEFRFRRLVLVMGLSRERDIADIARLLVPFASVLVLTCSSHPRAQTDLQTVAAVAMRYLHGILIIAPDIGDALDQAYAHAQSDDMICVTGSLFVVADARLALGLAQDSD